MKTALTLILALTVAGACGAKSKPETAHAEAEPAPSGTRDQTGAEGHTEEHEHMPPELAKFHDVLAPRWHAAKGPQRMIDTCSALVDLHKGVEGIAKAATPTAAEPRLWRDGTNELDAAVSALAVTCDLRDATAFEPAFERVHNGFHKMLEIAEGGSSAAKPGVP